ncbi:hypothetical protein JCM16303_005630 [Sporobolomyces ruberrimus]
MSSRPDPPPLASTSSSSTSPTSPSSSCPTPYYPASLSLSNSPYPPQSQSTTTTTTRHSRRPSRAERYEHLVENARSTLEKSRRCSGIPLTSPLKLEEGKRRSSYISLNDGAGGKRGSLSLIGERFGLGELGQYADEGKASAAGGGAEVGLGIQQGRRTSGEGERTEDAEQIKDREWRETVRNLLLVVDGMSQQLATHDELAAQLKIAQSNLTLAETHSEFLEETLRRREVSNGSTSGIRNSTSMQRNGRSRTAEENAASGGGGVEEVPSSSASSTGARSFFRLPTTSSSSSSTTSLSSTNRRKPTIPPPPLGFASAHSTPALRSVASSPRLGGGGGDSSPILPTTPLSPTDPNHPRFSTSTISSLDGTTALRPSLSPNPSTQSLPNQNASASLLQDFHSLRSAYKVLETECAALRVSEESVKRSNEMMVKKCADLEKTKEDLMSELENLSVELFSEANALVAEERRARAQAETKLEELQTQLNSLTAELASLRNALSRQSRPHSSQLDASSPDLPAIPRNGSISTASPLSLLIPSRSSSSTAPSSPNLEHSPSLNDDPPSSSSSNNRPTSTASVVSTGRKWFSFGRSPSIPTAPSLAGTDSTVSPNPSFSTPPLPSSSTVAPNGSDYSRTPSLSLSPYLDNSSTPTVSSPSVTPAVSIGLTGGDGLGIPLSGSMERSSSGSSYVTARSESWFGFGGTGSSREGHEPRMSEEPQELERARDEELAQEVIVTPVRSTFALSPGVGGRAVSDDEHRSPRPPKKEVSPARSSPKKPQPELAPALRPVSPSPSQLTTTSTISSSNKDLPATMASPPLPPLPASTPLSSALSSPNPSESVETDPARLPFSSSSTNLDRPPSTQADTIARPGRSTAVPRPLAIHIAASSSIPLGSRGQSPSANSFLTCPSPAPSTNTTPTTPNFAQIGGPSQAEMTAGAKSPRSPNELRWKEAKSSISQPNGYEETRMSSERRSRSRSAQSSSYGAVSSIDSASDAASKKDVLPPSPRIRGSFDSTTTTTSSGGKKPLPPTTKPTYAPSPPAKTTTTTNDRGGLRIDIPSTPNSEPFTVTPRPTERGPRSARPPSTSKEGSSRPSLFRHHSTTNSSTNPKNGLTTSSSISSLSSQLSESSTGHSSSGLLSGIKHGSLSRGSRAGKGGGVPLSPDGTKAVDDLEKLMESMMDMFE